MSNWIPEVGVHKNVPNGLYHEDRTAVSSTWIKTFQKTPFHLWQKLNPPEPDPESPPEGPSLALVKGSAVDSLVFEPDTAKEGFIILPEDLNLRTKDGRACRDEALEKASRTGQYVIKHPDWLESQLIADSIRANPMSAELLSKGEAQETYVWKDPDTGMLCKAKADFRNPNHKALIDLKTAEDGSPDAFSRSIAKFGYHIQDAFYSDGAIACGVPVYEFLFIVVEKPEKDMKPDPRLVSFYRITEADREEGRRAYKSALFGISTCMDAGEWPGYTPDIIELTRPAWAKRSDIEEL